MQTYVSKDVNDTHVYFLLLIGKQLPLFVYDVEAVETRVQPQTDNGFRTFGTLDCGLELMRDAWQRLDHVFSVEQDHTLPVGSTVATYVGPRYPLRLLDDRPVELLIVERGHIHRAHDDPIPERWELMVARSEEDNRPLMVLETWDASASTWDSGPAGKASQVRWERIGYRTRMRMLNATSIGGAIAQRRLVVTRTSFKSKVSDILWTDHTGTADEHSESIRARTMSNLLTPEGLIKKQHRSKPTLKQGGIDVHTEPMPPYQAWIKTNFGVRRLLLEELARGLGLDKQRLKALLPTLTPTLLQRTTSIYHWEFLAAGLAQTSKAVPNDVPFPSQVYASDPNTDVSLEHDAFHWVPPDLSIGGSWYKARLLNLMIASSTYSDPYDKLCQGIRMMSVHRANYTATHPDPKALQILWWEFPAEHWNDLRDGSSMNFLSPPPVGLTPNGAMTPEQSQIAGEFVDELVALQVLQEPPPNRPTECNAPLFLVPKEGQPGQWRCIANLLDGGQNSVVGNDPVFLPRVSHILSQMYTGGYSAVVDASKFFYQFSTRSDERKYLGMVHPITGKTYEYCGLPMGAGNSPALGGRYGLAFVRLLKARHNIFQGTPTANCWWTGFERDGTYDPKLGYGYILVGANGKPSVKIWVFVDDFLIHGPDYISTSTALTFFLDAAVTVGLLCHPGKLTPPQQRVKYCGFLLDTVNIPTQIMPLSKRERALAMVEYIVESAASKTFSRLALAVVAGVLESLVDGTPQRFGHTYLRRTHSLVHPPGIGTGALPYYTTTTVPSDVRVELKWWSQVLKHHAERCAHSPKSATLVPTWGDGSGTGTGGTLGLPDQPLHMWLGKWSPIVYSFSSNWKELRTLLITMQHLKRDYAKKVANTTIFYFTDNSTTYWIAASGSSRWEKLHSLITEIKIIERDLNCLLQVIHVPGVVMIQQGTDGLSRGIWMSPLHEEVNQQDYTRAVFDPLLPCPNIIQHYVTNLGLNETWHYRPWKDLWDTTKCIDRLTVWFPPPELARQVITFILETWVERPTTTSALFFIPRILLSFWRGLSKHLIEVDCIRPELTCLSRPPTLPIPIVVLFLPRHIRTYPKLRLDAPASSHVARWHREQAAEMRGLPPRLLTED